MIDLHGQGKFDILYHKVNSEFFFYRMTYYGFRQYVCSPFVMDYSYLLVSQQLTCFKLKSSNLCFLLKDKSLLFSGQWLQKFRWQNHLVLPPPKFPSTSRSWWSGCPSGPGGSRSTTSCRSDAWPNVFRLVIFTINEIGNLLVNTR